MKTPTVAELRKAGWKVGVHHQFYTEGRVSPREGRDIGPGWRTDVGVTPPGDEQMIRASACCNPKDAYNRRIGLNVALGRALKFYRLLRNSGDVL